MKKKFALAGLSLALFTATSAFALEVNSYKVEVSKSLYVPYDGSNKEFKEGFPTGFGSALAYKGKDADGSYEFYALTDRGPNADAPKFNRDGKLLSGKFFLAPNFQPSIAHLRLKNGKVTVEDIIPLKNPDGSKITGLPINNGRVGNTGEVAFDENLKVLPYDDNGLDPEGLAIDSNGHFWISDEYGPFAMEFASDGTMIKKLYPGEGLPEIFKYRTPNRGAEGLTITPNGTIVVMEQSILNLKNGDKSSGKTASFCRIAFINPNNGQIRVYGYPIDVETYKKPGDAKLGDIVAINENEFLIIEQGKSKDKKMTNLVYKFDISGADDLTNFKKDGLEPEYFADAAGALLAKKELVVDLRKLGWKAEKAEGLTILPDHQTIALINDNDFGVALEFKDKERKKAKITNYEYHEDGSFTLDGKKVDVKLKFEKNDEDERDITLFMIKLDKKLD